MAGYPNDQGSPAANTPVWLDVAPVADAQGRFPNDPRVSGGATPVFFVAGPGLYPQYPGYPNAQGDVKAAVPVRVVAQPDPNGPLSTDPALDQSAKPVWDVGTPTPEATIYPNSQANPLGAIPVYRTN
jgi:hypothetical protein